MSLTLINKSRRQEVKLKTLHARKMVWRPRLCTCGQWIFVRDNIPVEHHYLAELKPMPFIDVTLQVTVHNCQQQTTGPCD